MNRATTDRLEGLVPVFDRDFDFPDTGFKREFDPGSERTLAACLTHASRTGDFVAIQSLPWRTGEYHVGNLPSDGE